MEYGQKRWNNANNCEYVQWSRTYNHDKPNAVSHRKIINAHTIAHVRTHARRHACDVGILLQIWQHWYEGDRTPINSFTFCFSWYCRSLRSVIYGKWANIQATYTYGSSCITFRCVGIQHEHNTYLWVLESNTTFSKRMRVMEWIDIEGTWMRWHNEPMTYECPSFFRTEWTDRYMPHL